MEDLSIIISTYKNVQFLDDCFSSIISSQKSFDVEVLVGIDACVDTLTYVQKNTFPSNFKFVFFEKNQGPYIIFNTLSSISKSNNLLFFGSDDVMVENTIEKLIKNKDHEVVRLTYVNFIDGEEIDTDSKKNDYGGVFMISKKLFFDMNGFEPWLCEADTDFNLRLKKFKFSEKKLSEINFYRRIHQNGLTSNPLTSGNSELRKKYRKIIESKKGSPKIDKLYTYPFVNLEEVNLKKVEPLNDEIKEKVNKQNFIKSIIYN